MVNVFSVVSNTKKIHVVFHSKLFHEQNIGASKNKVIMTKEQSMKLLCNLDKENHLTPFIYA